MHSTKRALLKLLAIVGFALGQAFTVAEGAIDPALQTRLRAATFEVVTKKPERDSLTYEQPLPLDRLPFAERTDKYRSVGTAFAIGPNTYVSAAHVINVGIVSQYGEPQLRAANGDVRAIDQVLKYSDEQDFVVFSLKSPFKAQPLATNRAPVIDAPVFTAGNALGEGIVVREGLLTSLTPEEVNGRWQWLRFSAAASPGNSGGPLLDKQGNVLGVVLRKSANENLNYAAPIALITDAPDKVARLGNYISYQFPVMDEKEGERPNTEIALPKTYAQFANELQAHWFGMVDKLQARLLANNAANMFPRGKGSQEVLHASDATDPLSVIIRKSDGTWTSDGGSASAEATLSRNGKVTLGVLPGAMGAIIRKPDDVPMASFYKDSKAYMDYILKALPLQRRVGTESVRITSLGPALQESVFTDTYGRKWQVRLWNIEFLDAQILSYALPVPEGYESIIRIGSTVDTHEAALDLRTMTAFMDVSLNGNLEQWHAYLAQKDLLPAIFSKINIDFTYGGNFRYKSKRVDLSFPDTLQKVAKNSPLALHFGYFEDHGKVVWDVVSITVEEQASGGRSIAVRRHVKPDAALPDSFQTQWHKLATRAYPYDASAIEVEGDTSAIAIYPLPSAPEFDLTKQHVLYEVKYGSQGKHSSEEVKSALTNWFQGLRVHEVDDGWRSRTDR